MIIAVPVTPTDDVGDSWGKATQVAVADADADGIRDWTVYDVGWDVAHDADTHGAHHARVVRFLRSHEVSAVAVDHVGDGMARMLTTMGVAVHTGSHGPARAAVATIASQPQV